MATMRVVSRKKLRDFASRHADAEGPLDIWYRIARSAAWASMADVRATFPHADYVDPYTVFNIKGNTYRLIVKVEYRYQIIFIRSILTHAEYSKGTWR
jgi:mRNA interferase HigB